jgi:hypothetical protein
LEQKCAEEATAKKVTEEGEAATKAKTAAAKAKKAAT